MLASLAGDPAIIADGATGANNSEYQEQCNVDGQSSADPMNERGKVDQLVSLAFAPSRAENSAARDVRSGGAIGRGP
jgi:hypothetical protein